MPAFDKFMFDITREPRDFWSRFAPEESLSSTTNYYTLYHASETLKQILEGLKDDTKTQEDMENIEWLIFSCWDHYKSPPKYFITLLALKDDNDELVFINPFVENDSQPSYVLDTLNVFKQDKINGYQNRYFKNFINWWETEKFSQPPEIHFWDFLHSHKRFEWTICLTKNSSHPEEAFTLQIKAPSGVSYHHPNVVKATVPPGYEWWHFDQFPLELRTNTTTKEIFETLATGYVNHMCPENGFIYEFPLLMDIEVGPNSSTSYRSIGSLSIGAKKKLSLAKWEELVYRYIQGFYQIFPMRSFFERAKQNALQSAVGSIMARNMSHNIGSHVSPRASVEKIEQRLSDLNIESGAKSTLNILRLLKGELDEYNQKKSDFLSEITTEPLTTTAPALFYREIVLPFVQNSLLMDNLAANEGVNYKDKDANRLRIRLKVNDQELKGVYQTKTGDSSAKKYIYPDKLPYTLHESHQSSSTVNSDNLLYVTSIENGDEDVMVELPGPLGKFAFYAFLENLIRNTAKHNKKHFDSSSEAHLEIMINIKDHDELPDEFYQIEIFDNVTDPDERMLMSEDTSGDRTSPSRLHVIEKHIKASIIEDSGKLRREAWGLAEMKICAMLLSGSTTFANMENCLEVKREEIDGKPRLVYQFRMMKPKQLCAVLPETYFKEIGNEQITKLNKSGIYFFRSFGELTDKIAANQSPAAYRFFLLRCEPDTSIECANIRDSIHQLPFRIIISTPCQSDPLSYELKELNQRKAAVVTNDPVPFNRDSNELLHWLWQTWLTRRWLTPTHENVNGAIEKAVVDIYLEQKASESPTSEWIKHSKAFNRVQGANGRLNVRIWTEDSPESGTENDDFMGRSILYDRHGRGAGKVLAKQVAQSKSLDYKGKDTYIFLDKLNSDFSKIFCPTFPRHIERAAGPEGRESLSRWTFPYELAEAGLLRILVIDERLAEKCYTLVADKDARSRTEQLAEDHQVLAWHVAFGAKVYICTHLILGGDCHELHKQSYQQARKRAEAGVNEKLPLPYLHVKLPTEAEKIEYELSLTGDSPLSQTLQPDMVIIHQGILDWLVREFNGTLDQAAILESLRQNISFVVVDSGRGIPPSLKKTEKFMPYSVLQDYVADKRTAKCSLTQLAMSLTRREKGN